MAIAALTVPRPVESMPGRETVTLLISLLVAASLACGCLQEAGPKGPDLEVSMRGVATIPAIWNSSGLVEASPGHVFLVASVNIRNKGPESIRCDWSHDLTLNYGNRLVLANALTTEVTVVDPITEEPITSVIPAMGESPPLPPACITVVEFLCEIPDSPLEGASLSLSNATALGKGYVASVALPWSSVRVHGDYPPRLALRADHLQYLNRTAPGEQVPTRYLVANLTVTNGWSQPFPLALSSLHLLDGGGQAHAVALNVPWLNGQLAGGPLPPRSSQSGQVAFALPPPSAPARLVLVDAVPVAVEIDPSGIGYGK